MSARQLAATEVGLPRFAAVEPAVGSVFSLSSHRRAREALEFGLSIGDPGFNIFVLGEDRSGRMTATIEFLERTIASRPVPNDWIYLNNFRRPHRPGHYRLPAGVGRRFRDRMAALVPQLRDALARAFGGEDYQTQVRARNERIGGEVAQRLAQLRARIRPHGLDLLQTPQGAMIVAAVQGDPDQTQPETPERSAARDAAGRQAASDLAETNQWAAKRQAELVEWLRDFNRQVADHAVGSQVDQLTQEFADYRGLARWLTEMKVDILDNIERFRPHSDGEAADEFDNAEQRYAVNLLVDHGDDAHPSIVLEANPTYENLFGRIEYKQIRGMLRTDFSLIRAGSLHRANGGILVLRAEAIAADPDVWRFLKSALRDGEIRVEELYRSAAPPIAGAPRPKPIPLAVKVVIVGAPRWYYAFFSIDPDFQTYFKVKADIDPDMPATDDNLRCFAGMIDRMARQHGAESCDSAAIGRLIGTAARWAERRDRLTARFELIEDLVSEAIASRVGGGPLGEADVVAAVTSRRRRNARVEDRIQEAIADRLVMIDVTGAVVGQVNALTVRDLGDHAFGTPSRVTARASAGRHGVINIERDTTLGGPIQQKGVMVLQGFLGGRFARRIPMSFNCSITFEQSYGGVEGDSASIAELLAILSDLAGLPLRQDLAVTGSVNQRGQTQAVGGVHHKIEGFFRSCLAAGPLTGSQGVVIPTANEVSLVLRDEVAEAIAAERFHIWSVDTVEAAIELFSGVPAGVADRDGNYPAESVYGRVVGQLESFDRILAERLTR